MSRLHRNHPDLLGTYEDPSVADGTNARTATLDPDRRRLPRIRIARWRHTCTACGHSYLEGSERPNGICPRCGETEFRSEAA